MKEKIQRYSGLAISLFLLYMAIHYLDNFISIIQAIFSAAAPLLLGAIIAYIINILTSFFDSHYPNFKKFKQLNKFKTPVSLTLSFASIIGIITMIIILVIPELINCTKHLIMDVPNAFKREWTNFLNNEQINKIWPTINEKLPNANEIITMITDNASTIIDNMGGIIGSTFSFVTDIFSFTLTFLIAIIFAIYILANKNSLKNGIMKLISTYIPQYSEKILYVFKTTDKCFRGFITGQCIEAVILGVLCTIGMLIFKFPYAIMIGVLIGFTSIIPIAGAYIGGGIGAFMMLTISPTKALLFILFLVILQQIEGNLIYPKVVGNSIGLPSIWVLAAITIGGSLFGVIGMLVAVPIFATIYKLIENDVKNKEKNKEKNIKETKVEKQQESQPNPNNTLKVDKNNQKNTTRNYKTTNNKKEKR